MCKEHVELDRPCVSVAGTAIKGKPPLLIDPSLSASSVPHSHDCTAKNSDLSKSPNSKLLCAELAVRLYFVVSTVFVGLGDLHCIACFATRWPKPRNTCMLLGSCPNNVCFYPHSTPDGGKSRGARSPCRLSFERAPPRTDTATIVCECLSCQPNRHLVV